MFVIPTFIISNFLVSLNNFGIVNCDNTEKTLINGESITWPDEAKNRAGPGTPYPRVHNLILYSIKGDVANDEQQLFSHVYYLFRNVCQVEMDPTDIHLVRYLRKKYVTGATLKPAPVLVAIGNLTIKTSILHNRKRLRKTGVIIEHDLPREVVEAQNTLLKPLMEKYRKEGRYVLIRNGKLIVDGKTVTEIEVPDRMTYDPFSEEKYERLKVKRYFQELNAMSRRMRPTFRTTPNPFRSTKIEDYW